jgi:hypothetical protein
MKRFYEQNYIGPLSGRGLLGLVGARFRWHSVTKLHLKGDAPLRPLSEWTSLYLTAYCSWL